MKIIGQPPVEAGHWSIDGQKVQAVTEAIIKVAEIAKRNLQTSDNSGSLVLKTNETGEIDADAYDLLHNVLKQAYGAVKVKPVEGGVEFHW